MQESIKSKRDPLLSAVSKGNIEEVKKLVESKHDLNVLTRIGKTPLHLAAKKNQVQIAKILLDNKADPDRYDGCGFTVLMYAAIFNHDQITQALKDAKANLKLMTARYKPDPGDEKIYNFDDDSEDVTITACDIAILKSYPKIYKLLAGTETIISNLSNIFLTKKKYEMFEIAITYRPQDIYFTTDTADQSLLHLAAGQYNDLKAVELLIKHGIKNCDADDKIDVNIKDHNEDTPLHVACWSHKSVDYPDPKIISTLVKAKADVNAKNKYVLTPLHYAVHKQYLSSVLMLISLGANLQYKKYRFSSEKIYIIESLFSCLTDDFVIAFYLAQHGAHPKYAVEERTFQTGSFLIPKALEVAKYAYENYYLLPLIEFYVLLPLAHFQIASPQNFRLPLSIITLIVQYLDLNLMPLKEKKGIMSKDKKEDEDIRDWYGKPITCVQEKELFSIFEPYKKELLAPLKKYLRSQDGSHKDIVRFMLNCVSSLENLLPTAIQSQIKDILKDYFEEKGPVVDRADPFYQTIEAVLGKKAMDEFMSKYVRLTDHSEINALP